MSIKIFTNHGKRRSLEALEDNCNIYSHDGMLHKKTPSIRRRGVYLPWAAWAARSGGQTQLEPLKCTTNATPALAHGFLLLYTVWTSSSSLAVISSDESRTPPVESLDARLSGTPCRLDQLRRPARQQRGLDAARCLDSPCTALPGRGRCRTVIVTPPSPPCSVSSLSTL